MLVGFKPLLELFDSAIKKHFHVIHDRSDAIGLNSPLKELNLTLFSFILVQDPDGLVECFESIFESLDKNVGSFDLVFVL